MISQQSCTRSVNVEIADFLMICCLLIDDHEVVRIGLRFAIESAFPGSAVAEVGSLAAGLEHLHQGERTDLVLLDPGLPDAGGVSGLQAIREAHPDLPVVMVDLLHLVH